MTVVGWILFLTSSLALLSSSEANSTTEVVPSPTSLSCCVASETKIRACILDQHTFQYVSCCTTHSGVRNFK